MKSAILSALTFGLALISAAPAAELEKRAQPEGVDVASHQGVSHDF